VIHEPNLSLIEIKIQPLLSDPQHTASHLIVLKKLEATLRKMLLQAATPVSNLQSPILCPYK
jgi:hypothetical protein